MPEPFALGKPNIEHGAPYIITTWRVRCVRARRCPHRHRTWPVRWHCVCAATAAAMRQRETNDDDDEKKKKDDGRETRNEVRTAKGYDAPLGRIYPIPVYRRRHTDATNGENEIYGSNSIRPRTTRKILTRHTAQTTIAYTHTVDRAQHT